MMYIVFFPLVGGQFSNYHRWDLDENKSACGLVPQDFRNYRNIQTVSSDGEITELPPTRLCGNCWRLKGAKVTVSAASRVVGL